MATPIDPWGRHQAFRRPQPPGLARWVGPVGVLRAPSEEEAEVSAVAGGGGIYET